MTSKERKVEKSETVLLPRCVIAKILTYASVQSDSLRVLFRNEDESAWAGLCASRFGTRSDLLKDWPAFKSWRRLYHVLERFLPMEGFYTLLESNPIGMLFRFHFRDGRFVGSMMSPKYQDGDDDFFEDIPIFQLSFTETSHAARLLGSLSVRFGSVPEGMRREAMIAISRYPNMHSLKIEGRRIDIDLKEYNDEEDTEKKSIVSSILGSVYNSMRVLLNNDEEDAAFRRTPFRRLMYAWHPMNSDEGDSRNNYDGVSGKPLSMLRELVSVLRTSKSSQSLTFRYVNGPDEIDDVYRKGMPIIPSGIYHGCYNRMYGKFRREVILVYYKKYSWTSNLERVECEKRMREEIFSNGVNQSDPENLFRKISSQFNSLKGHAVWVLGRKVTGDYHVTCDRLTFCALVSHQVSQKDSFAKITMVRDRGDDGHGKTYPVLRRFIGCGTLAFPGFTSPHWDEGRLVQIECEDRSPSFAFVWGREQDFDSDAPAEGTVLRWVKDQDRFPFFSRRTRKFS